ncbi:ycf20-like protein [Dioscorea cayenensis subsp. rotundata]|uniref:Ycf20-like protein n=1 Tax=Dioscorea cayennensis subsp. rotundata TaxID=55577 RepID=A0AB40B7W5_DIOCR|nr:ycf20-like protein [Dioscorea cayenensis subsp. rotundata]XP_039123071.1 ycf20-like protein [Dioscorea cayenensis subsp. rotundata]XP_039123072.1 ycf20-like protein [Dioscorea cayenensis subsp. rotundata]
MLASPFCNEVIFHSSLKYSQSRFPLVAYLQKAAFGFDQSFFHHCCSLRVSKQFYISRRMKWVIRSMVDGSRPDPSGSNTNNGTRLVRAIQNFQIKLNSKLQELRKGLLMKVLFFLLGFYCATAFATVIGQTGDWDILSAGVAVVVVEAIGALMYRASFQILDKIKSLITFFNYWKAGLSLGLFLDAFKYEVDTFFESSSPFQIQFDILSKFW